MEIAKCSWAKVAQHFGYKYVFHSFIIFLNIHVKFPYLLYQAGFIFYFLNHLKVLGKTVQPILKLGKKYCFPFEKSCFTLEMLLYLKGDKELFFYFFIFVICIVTFTDIMRFYLKLIIMTFY